MSDRDRLEEDLRTVEGLTWEQAAARLVDLGWSKRCGCHHPPHPGLVCGYPIPYAEKNRLIIKGVVCGCEG